MARLGVELGAPRCCAVRGGEVVAAVGGWGGADNDLVFAVREGPLAGWVAALERIAPVELVEPVPAALSRVLARGHVTDAVTLFDAGADGIGLVEIRGGHVAAARRLFGDLAAAAAALAGDRGDGPGTIYVSPWREDRVRALAALLPAATLQPLPAVADVAAPFLPAYGAALAIGAKPDFARTLVSLDLERTIRGRHRREVGLAAAPCAAAPGCALASLGGWRARAARAPTARIPAPREP